MKCKVPLCSARFTHKKQVKAELKKIEVETYIIVMSARGRMLLGSLMKTAVGWGGGGRRQGGSVSSAGSSALMAGGTANSSE